MLIVTPELRIPLAEMELTYARSSGPGGQNVNKVNSKAVLRWNLATSPSLSEPLRARLLAKLGPRLNREGDLILTSDRYRDQPRNREDCLDKLRELLAAAAFVAKRRKKTKPTRGSRERNKTSKRKQSEKKRLRSSQRD